MGVPCKECGFRYDHYAYATCPECGDYPGSNKGANMTNLEQLEKERGKLIDEMVEITKAIEELKSKPTLPGWVTDDSVRFAISWDKVSAMSSLGDKKIAYLSGCLLKEHETAKQAYDDRILKTKILHRIEELNDGWVPDFTNGKVKKFMFMKNKSMLKVDYFIYYQYMPATHYMESEDIARQIMEEFDLEVLFK